MSIQPGIVPNLPGEDYHADTAWLSSTVLKGYLPERYKAGGSQEALDFGTLVHEVVLEPDRLDRYAVLDEVKIGVKADGSPAAVPTMTVAWKRAVAEAAEAGRKVVAQADWDKAHAMAAAIRDHAEAADLLHTRDGANELSAFWGDENGVRHKARFDRLIDGAIVDLKTTSAKPGAWSLAGACRDYGYDLSAAHYLTVAQGLDLGATEFLLVFVGKEAPHRVTVAELTPAFIARGQEARALAIRRATDPNAEPYEGATGRLALYPPGYRPALPTPTIPADFAWSLHEYA